MSELLLLAVGTGLGVGAVYALIAYGISLVWSVTRTLNFAHGDVLMAGVFVSLAALELGASAVTAVALSLVAAALLALALEKAVFFPLRERPGTMTWVLGVIVFAAIVRNVVLAFFSSRSFPAPISPASSSLVFGAIPSTYVWVFGVAVVAAVTLDLVVSRTAFGRGLRAVAESRSTAELMGVNTERTVAATFVIAAIAGGLAGLLIAPLTFVSASLGWIFTLKGFTAAIIGGIGRARGALAGGLILGVLEQCLAVMEAVVPEAAARYLSAGYRDAFAFLILIAVLTVRPRGLFGRPTERFA